MPGPHWTYQGCTVIPRLELTLCCPFAMEIIPIIKPPDHMKDFLKEVDSGRVVALVPVWDDK